MVKSLVLDLSTFADSVDNLKLECLQGHGDTETSPLDAQLLTNFLSGGTAVAHKFCAYGANGKSDWRESLFEALTAHGWTPTEKKYTDYKTLTSCFRELKELGALSSNDELILVLGEMKYSVATWLKTFVEDGCNVKIFTFKCFKDQVTQSNLKRRIAVLDNRISELIRPDLQPQEVGGEQDDADTGDKVDHEDQTAPESQQSSDSTSASNYGDTSDEEMDVIQSIPSLSSSGDNDFDNQLGDNEHSEVRNTEPGHSPPNDTENETDSDGAEDEGLGRDQRKRGCTGNGNAPQEQSARMENDQDIHELTSCTPDSADTEEEYGGEYESEDEADWQLDEDQELQVPEAKHEADEDCADEVQACLPLTVSSTDHSDRDTALQQPGIGRLLPEISTADDLAIEEIEKTGADKTSNDSETDLDKQASVCSLEAVAAKLAELLAALFD